MSDFALRFGLALIVVVAAVAAIIISRRNSAKSGDSEGSIEALRLELRRSMDAARAAMIKSVAITIRDNIFSAIKPIDSTVRDLSDRIARLEEHADAAANYMAGTQTQSLEEKEQTATRLAELEEHLTALGDQLSSIKQTVDGTSGREQDFKRSIDAINSSVIDTEKRVDDLMALGDQLSSIKQAVDEATGREQDVKNSIEAVNSSVASAHERVDDLMALRDGLSSIKQTVDEATGREQGIKDSIEAINSSVIDAQKRVDDLTVLSDQLSSIKQTVDGANGREQDIKHSIEAINSIVVNTERRVDELFPRLALGEKTHKDLGTLISLFVKRLKRVNASAAEIALRLGDLESRLPAKAAQPEERQGSVLEGKDCASTSGIEKLLDEAAPKAADGAADAGAAPSEANPESKNAGVFERPATPGEESSIQASVAGKGRSDDSRADEHVQSEAFSPSRA